MPVTLRQAPVICFFDRRMLLPSDIFVLMSQLDIALDRTGDVGRTSSWIVAFSFVARLFVDCSSNIRCHQSLGDSVATRIFNQASELSYIIPWWSKRVDLCCVELESGCVTSTRRDQQRIHTATSVQSIKRASFKPFNFFILPSHIAPTPLSHSPAAPFFRDSMTPSDLTVV